MNKKITSNNESLSPSQKTILFLKMFARNYRVIQFVDDEYMGMALS